MVQPVDIADNLAKTELIRKLNQKIRTDEEMEQREATRTFKAKTSDDTKRTQESIKSDMLIINKEQRQQEEKKKEKKKEEESDNQDNPDMDQSEDKHLDLKA